MELKLEGLSPVAKGGERDVFVHPENKAWLVKVYHQRFYDVHQKKYPIIMRFRRLKRYWSLVNELIEFIGIREKSSVETKYLQTIVGMVDTDLGIGMIVSAVLSEEGDLAPTLKDLVKNKQYQPMHAEALEALFQWMIDTHIIIRDFSLNNLVWSYQDQCFVIIDGIGSKATLSLRSFSKSYNQKANKKRVEKFRSRLAKVLGS
ncbi:YrbL family protein [Litoribrevibacter euphylliae]|uniref:YrbL family protein n=1 Tax=Litoribrevibacter euphylliae TaxID=1834034 RepID=A0ABV7HKE7_9GAMM